MKTKSFSFRILSIIVCLLAMFLAGYLQTKRTSHANPAYQSMPSDTTIMNIDNDGKITINTRTLASDVKGYGGSVPLKIVLLNGKIDTIICLENNETPMFFHQAEELLKNYSQKTIAEAAKLKVDAVSGATFSSRALAENMQRGMEYALHHEIVNEDDSSYAFSAKNICGIIVALLGATLPLFFHSRRMRIVLQLLNVSVLGLWCGTFISYSLMLSYIGNGINWIYCITPIIMLITAFIYPLFGKRNYYCNHLCPYGSLQELASHIPVKKIRLSHKTLDYLEKFRIGLWAILMFLLITGIWTAWIDLELFSAFIFKTTSIGIIVTALAFVVLSAFLPRPYCRFVCPTGSLMKFF